MTQFSCILLLALAGCGGSTGSGLVSFAGFAGGPAGLVAGQPFAFTSGAGYDLTLSQARMHLGAVYLNQARPSSGLAEQPCILPGVYVDQLLGSCDGSGVCGLDVDLLSPALVPFSAGGEGTLDQALSAEVWLTGGDIDAADNPTPILQVEGRAHKGGLEWPFSGLVSIGANHTLPPPNAAMPGQNPICRQRIVGPISLADPTSGANGLTIGRGATLTVRVDPTHLFDSVDFATLAASGSATTLTLPNDSSLVGLQLFAGLRSTAAAPLPGRANLRVYRFEVSPPN